MADRERTPMQESRKIRYAIAREFIPAEGRLEILQAFRQETVLFLNTGEPDYVTTIIFELAVKVRDRDELWSITLKPQNGHLYINHRSGIYKIGLNVAPYCNISTSASKTGSHGKELAPEIGCLRTELRSRRPPGYRVTLCLYHCEKNRPPQLGFAHPRLLHSTVIEVRVPAPLVERPLPRKKVTGILARPLGRRIIKHFQVLVHNGEYDKFKADEKRLFERIDGKVEFTDLKCVILFEESCAAYGKKKVDDVKRLAREASRLSSQSNSPNDRIMQAILKASMASAYRAEGKFDLAREELIISSELLENVVPGEETALYKYLIAALLADKSANMELSAEEKEEAERAFAEAMLHWNHQDHNQTNRIPMWASIRELCYRLNTQPQKAPRDDLVLNELELERVVTLANMVEAQILPTCPAVPKTILLLTLSDFWMLMREFEKAIDKSTQALNIAETFDLQKEIQGARERLAKRRQSSAQVIEQGTKVPTSIDDVSENPPRDDEFEGCLAELSRNELGNQLPIQCTMSD